MQTQPTPGASEVTEEVFEDPVVQLAAICPICALSALSPEAALAALSPVLGIFNPALNPQAALLSFAMSNPQAVIMARASSKAHGRMNQLMWKNYLRHPYLWYIPPSLAYPL